MIAGNNRAPVMSHRAYDLAVFGATGFVGRRLAEYLANHRDRSRIRLAIAGRDRGRLEQLRGRLEAHSSEVGIVVADARDSASIDALASAARVVVSTAGPFAQYGDELVAACVRHGTHYVDITGETVWVRRLIDRHHAQAARDGTRIVPFCGFDSVPSDLGALLVARRVERRFGARCAQAETAFRMRGGLNGGTISTFLQLFERGETRAARDPFLLDPGGIHPDKERARARDPESVRYDADFDAWLGPFAMGPINTRVVRRSAALSGLRGEPYGPDGTGFHYQEYLRYGGPLGRGNALLATASFAALMAAMRWPTSRAWLKAVLPKPGQGPSERTISSGWFHAETIGRTADGRRARTTMALRGDPGNAATLRFAAESGLCLALDADRLPGGRAYGGVLTPASALGEALVPRLRACGFEMGVDD